VTQKKKRICRLTTFKELISNQAPKQRTDGPTFFYAVYPSDVSINIDETRADT
jgi:hypothetical protein